MTLSDEQIAEWREQHARLATMYGVPTDSRVVALADALNEARRELDLMRADFDALGVRRNRDAMKLARVRDLADGWAQCDHVGEDRRFCPDCSRADRLIAALDGEGGGES